MPFQFKSSHLVSSISLMTLAAGLTCSQSIIQKSLAQTAPTQINGSGATFPAPLYTGQGGWFNTYGTALFPALNPPGPLNPDVQFNYAVVGSGAGINSFLTQTPPPSVGQTATVTVPTPIAFGATDAPLSQVGASLTVTGGPNSGQPIQVPSVAGAITLAYNREGLNLPPGGLRLSRETYCGIFTGEITNFNDRRIIADNGRQVAIELPITVVRRADGSGSTFIFSQHLNAICRGTAFPWNRGVGTVSVAGNPPANPARNTVYWPSEFLSANGGPGIASTISADGNSGAIGYVESSTRLSELLPAAALQNRAGNFIGPLPAAVTAAFTNAVDSDPNPRIVTINVPDPSQELAYPISGVTYLLFYDVYADGAVADGIRGFFNDFVATENPTSDPLENADAIARTLGYAPLSDNLKTEVRNVINTYVDTDPE